MKRVDQQHKQHQEPNRQRRVVWVVAALVGLSLALWLCVVVLPARLYPPLTRQDLNELTPAERAERIEGRAKLQNDGRTALLQGLGAVLVLVGAGLGAAAALRQVRVGRDQVQQAREQALQADKRALQQLQQARKQAQQADDQASRQLALAEEGQITERFTRAVDQLGSEHLDIRLGGIYALQRIAANSRTH